MYSKQKKQANKKLKHINLRTRAQASVEYLIIIGIALVIIVPGFYIFIQNSQRSVDQAVSTQVVGIGNQIVETVGDVFSYGRNAKLTARFSMPVNVNRVYLVRDNTWADEPENQHPAQELVFEVLISGVPTQFVFFSNRPMFISNQLDPAENPCTAPTGEFNERFSSQGRKNLEVTSCGQNVSLRFI